MHVATSFKNRIKITTSMVILCAAITYFITFNELELHLNIHFEKIRRIIEVLKDKNDHNVSCPSVLPIRRILPFKDNSGDNCAAYTKERQYFVDDAIKEERDFPIAYAIIMHSDIQNFQSLLSSIYRPQNYYCIHVDKKAEHDTWRSVQIITSCLRNTFVSSKRYDVKWGTFSVLQAELICMADLMKYKDWKYFINLTGHEMPLKTNLELVQILRIYNGANDISANPQLAKDNHKEWTGRAWTDFDHPTNKEKTVPPHNITLAKGEAHVICSRAFAEYVIYNETARDFLDWVKDVRVPDEYYFQSLNVNPQLKIPGSYKGITSDTSQVRYKLWMFKGTRNICHGHIVRTICNFGLGDLPRLMNATQLFANKFSAADMTPQTCVEHWIRKKTRSKITNVNLTFYANLPFVKYARISLNQNISI